MEDRELLKLLQEEDRKDYAFNLLLRQYAEPLYWHLRRMVGDHETADDLLQNTWLKAWKGLDVFRGESKLFTWLYTIAHNEALSWLRREKVRAVLSLSRLSSVLENRLEADASFDGDRLQARLQRAVLRLPPKQRSVFLYRYFEELRYEEISRITGISTGSLKASYHHAYRKVVRYLEETD